MCAPLDAEPAPGAPPRGVDREPGAGEFVEFEVAARARRRRAAEREHRRSGVRGHRRHPFVVGVEYRGARRRQRLHELALGDRRRRRSPRHVRCATWPTVVTTPMSGRATSHSALISPNPRIPISNTSTSVSSGALRIVTGRPCSLLKLRTFAVGAPRRRSTPRR